ncbi:hypothetical protein CDL15_Pgr016493 [Punica granatum]|uniref:Uncharacterized protein n=1 Tax=Punica granatum TaxID=22663 RepID=A0A218WK31_PUNGR|nr:hypothetical protein CDL15_Pgr016493 [Punica granatum]
MSCVIHSDDFTLSLEKASTVVKVGFHNAVDDCGSTDECPVLLNGRRELGTLYVEDGATWVSKCDSGLEEIPVDASGVQQGNISYERSDIVAVDRAQRRPYASTLLKWRCDSIEARTGE